MTFLCLVQAKFEAKEPVAYLAKCDKKFKYTRPLVSENHFLSLVYIYSQHFIAVLLCLFLLYSCLDHVDELLTILSDNPNITAGENIPEDAENVEVTLNTDFTYSG